MKIETKKNGAELTLIIEGRVDSLTAPVLESELKAQWTDVTKLVLDFTAVTFLSSAGIRSVLLAMKHIHEQKGTMSLKSVANNVREIFTMAGLNTVLNFE